jgi:carbon storage regulator
VLVLTRRANQSIMIGDDIVVTVLDVRGDQVRIGIKAPRSVDVHREEVFVALQRDAIRDASDEIHSAPDDVIDLVDAGVVEIVVARPRE